MLPAEAMRFSKCLPALAAGALLMTASAASAQDSDAVAARKIDRALRDSLERPGGTRRVIISVKPGYRSEIRKALRSHGDRVNAESALVETLNAEIHAEDIRELARHPWVQAVSDDAVVRAGGVRHRRAHRMVKRVKAAAAGSTEVATSTLRETLGLSPEPQPGTPTGAGIGVAIVDSGLTANADFQSRITGFYDFTRGGVATSPFDDYGHGTHVAGLIGSAGVLSGGKLMGVAPRVHFVGLKVLDKNGQGRTSDVINAIEFVVANKARLKVHIINLSLGHPILAPAANDPLVRAVEKATDAGLVVVASAGNLGMDNETGEPGYTGITTPGNAPSAITAGALNTRNTVSRGDDEVTPYSSRGPTWFDGFAKPDLVAPGHRLASDTTLTTYLFEVLKGNRKKSNSTDFLELSGTSMAAGVTSGVAALVLEANRRARQGTKLLTPNTVKAVMEFSAIPVPGAETLAQGTGGVNAGGAIALAAAIDPTVRSGDWWLQSGVRPSTRIGGVRYDWSQSIIWGDNLLSGDLVYRNMQGWALAATWGDNIVWGTSAFITDDNIVWGTTATWAPNIVWRDRVIGQMDGDNIVWGTNDDNIVWGTSDDNIVWGTLDFDNIVWGTYYDGDNIVWGTFDGDNIVWGTYDDDNIVWGTYDGDNIVWGTSGDDNIVWGTFGDDNIVWGTAVRGGF